MQRKDDSRLRQHSERAEKHHLSGAGSKAIGISTGNAIAIQRAHEILRRRGIAFGNNLGWSDADDWRRSVR